MQFLVDANIFLYNIWGHPAFKSGCQEFLVNVENGVYAAITSTLILNEVVHKLMLAEATKEYAEFKNAFSSRPNIQEIILAPVELKAHPPVLLDLTTDVIILHDTGILKEEIDKLKKMLKELGAKRVERKGSWHWIT